MDNPWILTLPGLRRYREQIRSLVRLVKRLEERSAQQDTRVAALRDKLARETRENLKLQPLRQRLETQVERTEKLRGQMSVLQERLQKETRRNASLMSRVVSPQPVEQTLPARRKALLASSRRRTAALREADFLALSPAYLAAVGKGESLIPAGTTDQAEICGLVFWVPKTSSQTGNLAHRILQRRWLPFVDILASRELALGTVMLDIGANVGTTSIPRVVAGDVQHVYAAEPDPLNYACLVRNVCDNGLQGFVFPDQVAISDTDGMGVLFRSGGMGTQRLLQDTRPDQGPATASHTHVRTVTLDRWVRDLQIEPELICCVKSDTQGWESHVLAGARQLLSYRNIAWIIEFSPRHLVMAGSGSQHLIEQMQANFTHFIDLRGGADGRRVREVGDLPDAVSYITDRAEKRFTDLLLYSAS